MSVLDYYDDIAGSYDETRFKNSYGRFVDSAERAILSSWLVEVDTSRVIDFGCGTGRFLEFADTGVDGSPNMLEVAAGIYPKHRLVHADLMSLPDTLTDYEAGICFHVTMHLDIEQIRQLFAQAVKVIRPGGRLIIDFLAAPRRRHASRQKLGWHGNTALSIQDVIKIAAPHWKIKAYKGILMLPIHRFPNWIRPSLTKLDALLCRSPLFPWSSYYVIELESQRCE